MTSTVHTFDTYADVRRALANPLLVPVPAASGPVGTMAWLRASVARFSSGTTHERRRMLLEADLARADPATLRYLAASGPADQDDRRRVVRAVAAGMGLADPDAVAAAIPVVADTYFGGDDPAADAAVAWLLPLMAVPGELGSALEVAANRIGIFVQACDATAGLIAHARRASTDVRADVPIEALLAETLRHDPPVRAMRRIAARATRVAGVRIAEGDLVVLDIAAANRDPAIYTDPDTFDPARAEATPLTFGAPPRLCPGRAHALALAAAVLEGEKSGGTGSAP